MYIRYVKLKVLSGPKVLNSLLCGLHIKVYQKKQKKTNTYFTDKYIYRQISNLLTKLEENHINNSFLMSAIFHISFLSLTFQFRVKFYWLIWI